jgi:hypothetical protein
MYKQASKKQIHFVKMYHKNYLVFLILFFFLALMLGFNILSYSQWYSSIGFRFKGDK